MPNSSVIFEGIPTENGIQELLFSLPRYGMVLGTVRFHTCGQSECAALSSLQQRPCVQHIYMARRRGLLTPRTPTTCHDIGIALHGWETVARYCLRGCKYNTFLGERSHPPSPPCCNSFSSDYSLNHSGLHLGVRFGFRLHLSGRPQESALPPPLGRSVRRATCLYKRNAWRAGVVV